jgi:very-short-patch-repair endonuclease
LIDTLEERVFPAPLLTKEGLGEVEGDRRGQTVWWNPESRIVRLVERVRNPLNPPLLRGEVGSRWGKRMAVGEARRTKGVRDRIVTKIFNRATDKAKRRRLRNDMPRAEVLLWSKLRARQLNGLKFRRQYGVGPYVVDFFCAEARLAVEVDGDTHFGDGAEVRDRKREEYIGRFGIIFLRCTNEDVYERIDGVLEEIQRIAAERLAQRNPPQSPLVKGGSKRGSGCSTQKASNVNGSASRNVIDARRAASRDASKENADA